MNVLKTILSCDRIAVLASISLLSLTQSVQAQLTPDTTLGPESSILTPGVEVQDALADLIEGGAQRGGNLFHSFEEFNIADGQRVYFANPVDVDSILSRVTGANPSEILGVLGVNGPADLFLLNPNGIVFGETARLDIDGAFYATTADAVEIGDGSFSASVPEQSQLLTVKPNVLFWNYLTENSGDIVNRGQLATGGDLMLAGNNLDLQGQVAVAGDLSLLATDTIKIRDTAEVPFVGFAGGELLVQGNQQVDIVALSHPDSGLFSYGDMVLRSAERIGGDAHYWSGGSFRVEQLDSSGGELFSPIDPIIRALGDVVIGGYQGTSLHILAGGSVNIGTAVILAPEEGSIGIDFLQETLILSDGTPVEIDGRLQLTLDIRAGINPEAISLPTNPILTGFTTPQDRFFGNTFATDMPTSADIIIGDILIFPSNGLVLLTNQHQPNTALNGDLVVSGNGFYGFGINATGLNDKGSEVLIDVRNDVSITSSAIDTSGLTGGGDITIISGETVRFDGADGTRGTGAFSNLISDGNGIAGNIRIDATNLEVLNGAQLNSIVFGDGRGGKVTLNIRENARFEGINPMDGSLTGVLTVVGPNGEGKGGNIQIDARNLRVLDGAQLSAGTFSRGDAGNVVLEIEETALFDGYNAIDGGPSGASSGIQPDGEGRGGKVQITARNLQVLNGAELSTSTFGAGNAGDVILEIEETALFDGYNATNGSSSGAFSQINDNGMGNAGEVRIIARNLQVLNGAQVAVNASGIGNAGDIILAIEETALFDGVVTLDGDPSGAFSTLRAVGRAGQVEITARNLQVLNGALISASTFGVGDSGSVVLQIEETAHFEGMDSASSNSSGVFTGIQPDGRGVGGDLQITARNLNVIDGAQLTAGVFGIGDAGDVILSIEETIRLDRGNISDLTATGIFSSITPTGRGQGGDIRVVARNLEVVNGASITASTEGIGDAGDIILEISETAYLEGVSSVLASPSGILSVVASDASGQGGDVKLSAENIVVLNGAGLFASSFGNGDAGNIELINQNLSMLSGTIATNAEFNAGGQIQIDADTILLFGDSDIQTFVNSGADNGGDITITADAIVALDDSDILAFAADGRGGNVDLSRTVFFGQDFALAPAGTDPRTLDGNDRVDINATGRLASGTILLPDDSFIEDSLTELPENLVNPETLVATSCIARSNDVTSSFQIIGNSGLAQQPNDSQSTYSLGTVQTIPDQESATPEPHGVYRLADGRLVMSRECR